MLVLGIFCGKYLMVFTQRPEDRLLCRPALSVRTAASLRNTP
jgi:hypothetical protein